MIEKDKKEKKQWDTLVCICGTQYGLSTGFSSAAKVSAFLTADGLVSQNNNKQNENLTTIMEVFR